VLSLAIDTAIRAGDFVQEKQAGASRSRKLDGTIFTEADKQAETMIREKLETETSYDVIGEEFGPESTNMSDYWLVDPIDGTNNYSYGNPLYGVAIALIKDNEPYLGVFYAPELNETYYAKQDSGAYVNQKQLSVATSKERSEYSLTVSGYGLNTLRQSLLDVTPWVQVLGSSIICGSWISSGRVDGGVFCNLSPWDIAVSVILIREAGGTVSEISSGSTKWEDIQSGMAVSGDVNIRQEVTNSLTEEIVEKTNRTRT